MNCFTIVYSDLLKDIDKGIINLATKKRPMLKLRKEVEAILKKLLAKAMSVDEILVKLK